MKTDQNNPEESPHCPSCGSSEIHLFHSIEGVPVNSVKNIYTREEALAFQRGDISVGFCKQCGFVYNTLYNQNLVKYSSDCEESQGYSPTFNAFARRLAQDLVEKFRLHDKRIVEIGCGKGEFLRLVCSLGRNSGVGFDPAYTPGRGDGEDLDGRIEFVKDYYSEKYAGYHGDLICCRMTLEHIFDVGDLVRTVRSSIGERQDTQVLFQVPDVTRIMKKCAFEDIYYEHCSYFSSGSLARLFRRSGFHVVNLETAYDNQYILLEATPANGESETRHPAEDGVEALASFVMEFERNYPSVMRYWETLFERFSEKLKKVVIWGGGSKGVTFLNTVHGSVLVDYVVDINPHRQGTFMAGTGQRIVAPLFLKDYRPDVVIIMNHVYRDEIQNELDQMGLKPSVITLKRREQAAN